MPRSRSRLVTSLIGAVATVLVLGACGSDDDGGSDGLGDSTIVITSAPATPEEKRYVPANQDGSCPDDHPVKVLNVPNEGNRHFTPDSSRYDSIRAGFCFEDAASAEAKGFPAG